MAKAKFALFIFLSALLDGTTYVKSSNITKLDLLTMQVLEPYESHITSFTNFLKSSLMKSIHSILLGSLEYQGYDNENDHNDYRKPSRSSLGENLKESYSPILSESFPSNRMLRSLFFGFVGCANKGLPVNVSVTLYICNERNVDKFYYDLNKAAENCSVSAVNKELCYCPYDYFGRYCESFNILHCNIKSASNLNQQCQGKDSKYYAYSYAKGDMPCYYAQRNSNLEFVFQLKCEHEFPKWNYEGIKLTEEVEYIPVILKGTPFIYEVDSDKLKMSVFPVLPMTVKFINWRRLFEPRVEEALLTPGQILGIQNITFKTLLNSGLEKYRIAGRYYYEVEIDHRDIKHQKLTGNVEDSNYTEPVKKDNDDYPYTFYIIGTILILLVVFLVVSRRKISPLIEQLKRRSSYELLVEMPEKKYA